MAGYPARLMRVGFVGELGYELHVPSLFAAALWDAVVEAGARWHIKPFGVEAQRLLRLEKGHIIVGQDTDGMTHPGEVGLDWAMNRTKPDFVGRRSVDILAASAPIRQLVGFSLDLTAPKPLEGHLVIKGGDIVGNVTSCEISPTLNQIIGLAYAHPDDASPAIVLRSVPRVVCWCRPELKLYRFTIPTTRGSSCEPAQSARGHRGDRRPRRA